ncbi:MAG: DUF255 domain-containing protein [Arthrobacter sp.]
MAERLKDQASAYLRQHAGNPVDWWPFGDEAFAEARRRDVPVFISIGYAACHWCHVMAHESFEDPETARILNRDFVSIKVDREERPDGSDCRHGRGAGRANAHRHGAGRHLRPGGRRLRPVHSGPPLAGAALREDAV